MPSEISREQYGSERGIDALLQERLQHTQEEFILSQGATLAERIDSFNKKNAPQPELAFALIRTIKNSLVIIDEIGLLRALEIDEHNAAEVLQKIKTIDETLHADSYDLRKAILERSNRTIQTYEAYTYPLQFPKDREEFYTIINNPDIWLEQRRLLQGEIIEFEFQKALALSKRLEDTEPTIYALRGNTAAGKTSSLRNDHRFHKALDAQGKTSGAINPDTYKQEIREEAIAFGKYSITSGQAHFEGGIITEKIQQKLRQSDSSLIIDQRLNEASHVRSLIKKAEIANKKVKFLDIDSPLEVSLVRVLGRRPSGEDPVVPFGIVAGGFNGVRKNREELIQEVMENDRITDYVLYSYDEKGTTTLVAEKSQGVLHVFDGQEKRYQEMIDGDTEELVKKLKNTIIDDAYIANASERLALNDELKHGLERYKGRTLSEALDTHALFMNDAPPSLDEYLAIGRKNFTLTSDTEHAAPNVIQHESANFDNALRTAYASKDAYFDNPREVREFIETLARTINMGTPHENNFIRPDTEQSMDQFYKEFCERLHDPHQNIIDLAAWTEYRIDIADHFFIEGCDKIAKTVSAWILMRSCYKLPDYSAKGSIAPEDVRSEYYRYAPKDGEKTAPNPSAEELNDWRTYYKKLCT